MTTLTPDERADLHDVFWRAWYGHADFLDLVDYVTELCAAYYAAGLVEGDLGHDGTIRAEVEA